MYAFAEIATSWCCISYLVSGTKSLEGFQLAAVVDLDVELRVLLALSLQSGQVTGVARQVERQTESQHA